MIKDNPKVSPGLVDCSLYTSRFALEDDYQKRKIDVFANTSAEFQRFGDTCKEL